MASLRLRATPLFDSFLGTIDLKLGVTLVSLFAALNKVAGAFGLLALVLSGREAFKEPLAQLSMYLYSMASLGGVVWGLQQVSAENGPSTLLYAHLFALDHLLSTLWTAFFAVVWYAWVPHDGRRVANSDAQKAMMGGSQTTGAMTDEARAAAASEVWSGERGFSAFVLVVGWFIKVYFILILYSFALHLRHNTYPSLPLSARNSVPSSKYGSSTSSSSPHPSRRPGLHNHQHTRHSSTGGAHYTHLRGNSLASTAGIGGGRGSMDGLDGTETTMAETLWEDDDEEAVPVPSTIMPPPALGERRPSGRAPAPVTVAGKLAKQGEGEPQSPAFAKGTAMARGASGGVLVSGGGGGKTEENAEGAEGAGTNPFKSILGRLSMDQQR
ncbi:hypothetical protein JCM8547_009238 [Rhodosporidiobolus lusitaniae]